MSAAVDSRTLPLVAVLYDVPLFVESLEGVFERIAEVRAFRLDAGAGGLLRSLRPDAVIVEAGEHADDAAAYALEASIPVVRVDLRSGTAQHHDGARLDATPTEIRNAIAGALAGGAA